MNSDQISVGYPDWKTNQRISLEPLMISVSAVKLIFTEDHISVMMALKEPVVNTFDLKCHILDLDGTAENR